MKDNIRAVALAVALVVAGLFWWHVAELEDCRNLWRKAGEANSPLFLKSECPQIGPYTAGSSVILFAVLSSLFPSATAEQRSNKSQ